MYGGVQASDAQPVRTSNRTSLWSLASRSTDQFWCAAQPAVQSVTTTGKFLSSYCSEKASAVLNGRAPVNWPYPDCKQQSKSIYIHSWALLVGVHNARRGGIKS